MIACGLTALYGLGMVLRADVAVKLFDLLRFGPVTAGVEPGPSMTHVLFAYSVLGAVILGWMVLLLMLAAGPMRRGQRDVGVAVLSSMVAWFVVDTAYSLAVGSWEHALFNVAFLVLLAVPWCFWWASTRRGTP